MHALGGYGGLDDVIEQGGDDEASSEGRTTPPNKF